MLQAIHDVPAPAKLNLFLHVLGRRADGLHELQSAFQLIDWCDRLHFEKRPNARITRTDRTVALPADDLTVRAARALQAATGSTAGVHIEVEKYVPAEAGLGGGSSDAASCLLALNRLWALDLPLAALERIGLSLGADVPFFLHGCGAAWVEGVGERIAPVALPVARFVVLKPPAGLSTASIFTAASLKRDTVAATIPRFAADPWRFGRNDLQPVAEGLCSDVSLGLKWLAARGLDARMTGSGSALFATLAAEVSGLDWPAAPIGWQMRICSSLWQHPLKGWAAGNEV